MLSFSPLHIQHSQPTFTCTAHNNVLREHQKRGPCDERCRDVVVVEVVKLSKFIHLTSAQTQTQTQMTWQ
jgi:hypothetical protein